MYKPEVGQTLYSLNVGNSARGVEQKLTPVKVTKVGRKYFTCAKEDSSFETQYHLEDWSQKTEYSAGSALYTNPEEWEDEKERTSLRDGMSNFFGWSGDCRKLTLAQLREINKIIED